MRKLFWFLTLFFGFYADVQIHAQILSSSARGSGFLSADLEMKNDLSLIGDHDETLVSDGFVFNVQTESPWVIVVLGSSTAEGTGPKDPQNAWVKRYQKFLQNYDSRFQVVNLARGGYTTYHILPDGAAPVAKRPAVDSKRNITKALSLRPAAIIVNMPSNDAASGIGVEEQMKNFAVVAQLAKQNGVPIWFTTPQPRLFKSDPAKVQIQLDLLQAMKAAYGKDLIDFWSGFGEPDGNGILPQYNVDNIHINDEAHKILFERVKKKKIHKKIRARELKAARAS